MLNLSERASSDRLMRPIEVRRLLGVCATTLWNWGQLKLLEPSQYTAGGHARYLESEVTAFKAELANPAVKAAA